MTQCSISADTDHDLELPDQVYVCKEVRKFRPSRMKQSLLPGTRSRGGYEIFEVSLQPKAPVRSRDAPFPGSPIFREKDDRVAQR